MEQGDFTPLIFTTTGGMGPQCEKALKKLTERMAEKRELPSSVVAGWLRCRFSFALLRTSLICLRGTRRRKTVNKPNVELAVREALISYWPFRIHPRLHTFFLSLMLSFPFLFS